MWSVYDGVFELLASSFPSQVQTYRLIDPRSRPRSRRSSPLTIWAFLDLQT